MGETTAIEWCHHTFNPWRGCTHVSPGCEHCYAESLSNRYRGRHGTWGAGGARVIAAESYWRQPLRWNAAAEAAGERRRVFCASLADVFELPADSAALEATGAARERLFGLIAQTPALDWLLLTKRPEIARAILGHFEFWLRVNADRMQRCWPVIPGGMSDFAAGRSFLPNVWIGISAEDQRRLDERMVHLVAIPAAVRFISFEPLLEQVDAATWFWSMMTAEGRCAVSWAIVGGESGPGARPMHLDWARALVDQCRAAGVACFVKQLGARPVDGRTTQFYVDLRDRKGGDPADWPEELRVREWPT